MKSSRPFLIVSFLGVCLLAACGKHSAEITETPFIFNPVDTNFHSTELLIPGGNYDKKLIYTEGQLEKVEWKGVLAPAKGSQDYLVYIPLDSSSVHGILWVNHESTGPHPIIGDGGGASVMEVFRDTVSGWKLIGFPHAIDFSGVGGTLHNCLGATTPWGTILSSEEIEPMSNYERDPDDESRKLISDSSDFAGRSRWMNYGWMVEVDPMKRKVLGKRYAMGRFMHEGNVVMSDEKTVYMCDDAGPGAFFKFVADTAQHLGSGRLYAWQMKADSNGRHWIPLPQSRDSLLHARRFAFQRGASIFNRMEDMELLPDGSLLISESGKDSCDMSNAVNLGGKVMPYLEKYHVGNQVYDDRHGRILRYDPKTETMSVFLEGGQADEDRSIVLSNPDNLAVDLKRNLLVIVEDVNGASGGRVPGGANAKIVSEIYFLNLAQNAHRLDDLKRFAVLPPGCEATGPCWTPDYQSLFLNIRNSGDKQNPVPKGYEKSMTIVVTGFPEN